MSKHLKILLGGSPCTHWSIAQKNNRETEASGIGWELFKNYLYARDKFKPDYFLYENNKSAAQPIKDQISKELGADLQYINSALVSAQNRQRFYGHNIPGVPQPQDRGILIRDVLGSVCEEKGYALRIPDYGISDKARPLGANYSNNAGAFEQRIWHSNPAKQQLDYVAEPIRNGTIESGERSAKSDSQANRVYSYLGKSVTLNANGDGGGAKTGLYACPLEIPYNGKTYPVYEVKNGLIEIKGKQYPIKLNDGYYIIRKLTVNECRRLQTVPDWYKMPCSASQNYKMLGNGWTIEVIKHILSHIPNIANCTIEVLSMYSGMNCDLITLTELGSKIVRCVDYEIDKYAIQTASANFPYIEHRGDAFQLRNTNWSF